MKCLILAAGYATRLYPLTENFPKPLLKVGEKTILDWLVDDIDTLGRVDEYVVISNHKYAHHFSDWAKTKAQKITVVDDGTSTNETRLGAVRDIQFAIDALSLDDDMLVIAGDNVLDFSLTKLISYAEQKGTSCVMRYYEQSIEKLRKCGVADVDENDLIRSLEEKPAEPKSHWATPPFYFYTKKDARLVKEGIRPYMFEKEEQTAYAAILTDDAGENRVTVFAGAKLEAADMRAMEDAFREAKMLLITPEIPEEAFAEAVALAKKHGVKIVINPAPFMDWVRPYLKDAWCVTPNRSEAMSMLGIGPEEELMAALPHSPCPRVLVTLGSEGAVCMEDGVFTQIPACKVKAVDTTGAGDCFNGALCARLLAGDSLAEAAKTAVKAASMSVQHAHVLDGMPYAHEVK